MVRRPDLIVLKNVTVYCGSADGLDERYTKAAMRMGAALATISTPAIASGGNRCRTNPLANITEALPREANGRSWRGYGLSIGR